MAFSLDSFLYDGLTKCAEIHLTVPESEVTEKSSFELLVDIGLVSSLAAVNLHLCLEKTSSLVLAKLSFWRVLKDT